MGVTFGCDLTRLHRETPVRIAGDDHAIGSQDTPNLGEHREWACQVLDPDTVQDGIDGGHRTAAGQSRD